MIVYLESLGCSRNQVDSEVMLGKLRQGGHTITKDPSQAETIIVNTCGFISAASEEAVDTILAMAAHKKSGICKRLIVTGCLPQRYQDDDLEKSLPEVDAFLGTSAGDDIVKTVEGKPGRVLTLFPEPSSKKALKVPLERELTLDYSAYVKLSEGCDHRCTYCIIPKLRGPQKSRPVRTIAKECEALLIKGVKEINLVAENSTDYGSDFDKNRDTDLTRLLKTLSDTVDHIQNKKPAKKASPVWVRLLYTHPASLSRSIVQTVTSLDNILTYFDVPIQHASSRILKRMGRHYTRENLFGLFSFIRQKAPDAALRTTLITGFPGETEDDFQSLLTFIEDIRFDHLGVFTYSDSEDLKSHGLDRHVPKELAMERRDLLMERQADISEIKNLAHLGRTYTVLVEENPDEGIYLGRTWFQAPEVDGITFIYGSGLEIGTFTDVKITETHAYDLAGEIA